MGWHNLADTDFEGVAIEGTWHKHSKFDAQNLDHDIALIELHQSVTLTPKIETIPIAKAGSDVAPGTKLLVSGWGSIQCKYVIFIPMTSSVTCLRGVT